MTSPEEHYGALGQATGALLSQQASATINIIITIVIITIVIITIVFLIIIIPITILSLLLLNIRIILREATYVPKVSLKRSARNA